MPYNMAERVASGIIQLGKTRENASCLSRWKQDVSCEESSQEISVVGHFDFPQCSHPEAQGLKARIFSVLSARVNSCPVYTSSRKMTHYQIFASFRSAAAYSLQWIPLYEENHAHTRLHVFGAIRRRSRPGGTNFP